MPNKALRLVFLIGGSIFLHACTPAPEKVWQRSYDESRSYVADVADDASFSVVSSDGQELLMWHRDEARPRFRMQQEQAELQQLIGVDISADGQYVAAASSQNFALWQMTDGTLAGYWRIQQEVHPDPDFVTAITNIVVSKQGDVVALGLNSGKVIIFNPRNGRRLEMFGHTEQITALAIAPNGKYLLSASYDGSVFLWNTDTAAIVQQVTHEQPVMQVALDDNGQWFFSADRRNDASIWSVTTGERQARLQFNDRQRIFSTARFSHDGDHLITGTPSRVIELWDVATGDRRYRLRVALNDTQRPSSATVLAVGLDPQQKTLWSENSAGIAELWKLPAEALPRISDTTTP